VFVGTWLCGVPEMLSIETVGRGEIDGKMWGCGTDDASMKPEKGTLHGLCGTTNSKYITPTFRCRFAAP
jgi:hypothetical protein